MLKGYDWKIVFCRKRKEQFRFIMICIFFFLYTKRGNLHKGILKSKYLCLSDDGRYKQPRTITYETPSRLLLTVRFKTARDSRPNIYYNNIKKKYRISQLQQQKMVITGSVRPRTDKRYSSNAIILLWRRRYSMYI